MSYVRAALEWEIPEYEAKRILPLYHQAYPGIERGFQDGIIRQLSNNRVVTNCFGRKRQFLNRIDWKKRNSPVFYDAFGFLPQSTIADLMLEGMIKIYEDVEPPMDLLEFLMQNHDSILLQYPIAASNPDDMAKAILKCCDYLNPVMKYSGREFQIENELKIGNCWGNLEEVTLGTSTRGLVKRLSEVLREL
jgi:DNA polymerase I-like protein with 3'-5' exonuclease and polymerase domains